MAGVWGQQTQPRRGSSRFLRPRLLSSRIQLASQACFFARRTSKTFGFYVVPCFPRLSSPTRGSPRPEITRKCCSKSPVKRSFKTAAGQKRTRTMARWPGFGGAAPLEIRPPSLEEVVLGRRGACWFVLGRHRMTQTEAQRLPQVNSPKSPPTGLALLPGTLALGAHLDS